jgi:hypothetical protein
MEPFLKSIAKANERANKQLGKQVIYCRTKHGDHEEGGVLLVAGFSSFW